MQFLEKQFLMVVNLLSYKARVDSRDLDDMLLYAERNLDALELELTGNTILNVSEIITEENKRIFGIEILFPVDKPFESRGQCIYKPVFKLENAVMSRFYNGYHEIPEIAEQMLAYIKCNNMKPATDVYFVIRRDLNDNAVDKVFDAYVAVDSNIV